MFNLESSITNWREKMFAAGISAAALGELESHLLDEIERQIKSGLDEPTAFAAAAQRIGQPKPLKAEFAKNRSLLEFFYIGRFTITNRILAFLWFAGFVLDFVANYQYFSLHHGPHDSAASFSLMVILINVTGMAGCVLLFRGSMLGRRIIRSVALIYLVPCTTWTVFNFGQSSDWRIWNSFCTAVCLLTIWLLHRTPKQTAVA